MEPERKGGLFSKSISTDMILGCGVDGRVRLPGFRLHPELLLTLTKLRVKIFLELLG